MADVKSGQWLYYRFRAVTLTKSTEAYYTDIPGQLEALIPLLNDDLKAAGSGTVLSYNNKQGTFSRSEGGGESRLWARLATEKGRISLQFLTPSGAPAGKPYAFAALKPFLDDLPEILRDNLDEKDRLGLERLYAGRQPDLSAVFRQGFESLPSERLRKEYAQAQTALEIFFKGPFGQALIDGKIAEEFMFGPPKDFGDNALISQQLKPETRFVIAYRTPPRECWHGLSEYGYFIFAQAVEEYRDGKNQLILHIYRENPASHNPGYPLESIEELPPVFVENVMKHLDDKEREALRKVYGDAVPKPAP